MISLSHINKHYGDYHALRDVDLHINAGEFFSLLGPSGCGKTTLLRTIAGFETPSSGTLMINDQDMKTVPANKRPTNMVFQNYAIFPHLNVAENVAFGLRKSNLSKIQKAAAVDEMLQIVGLCGFGQRSSHALSGGQRQRVALARALILKPKVLLLDEPLSALDKKLRDQMQSELRRLQRQVGITFILVTHDQEEALIMSDRVAVMFEGQIAQLDTPQALYKHPKSKHVADFIGMMNFLPASLSPAGGGKTTDVNIAGLGQVSLHTDQICTLDATGHEAVAGLRPETMAIVFDDTVQTAHTATGIIQDRAYYGDMTYYDVMLAQTSQSVTISMKNISGRAILDPPANVTISWDPHSVTVFPQ